ncbi:hypothetical protein OG422_31240 (plasmid) [Streptomyces sp. NBC_01525]|uniref:DNA polymerase III subunit beta family protein n=1 Tax=Streptomyces sp. NBC_01525 TaxID=2903893 RepID=UPI002F915FCE
MTTLSAARLHRILQQTTLHMSDDETLPVIHGLRLDSDGVTLHAIGTDRYTLAIARTPLHQQGDAWARTLPATEISTLNVWLSGRADDERTLTLTPGDDTLTVADGAARLTVPTLTTDYPAWRDIARTALVNPLSPTPTRLRPALLARFRNAGETAQVWHSTPGKPLIVLAEDYLGLQVPTRTGAQEPDQADALAQWATTLGTTGPRAQLVPPRPAPGAAEKLNEQLLQQTILDLDEAHAATTNNLPLYSAWADAAVNAWTAHRLLAALRIADPDRAAALAETLTEEVEGALGELAHDAARADGYDPLRWQQEYAADKAERAALRAPITA